MARRLGAERIKHIRVGTGFDKPDGSILHDTYPGCAVIFGSSAEGIGLNENLTSSQLSVYIPKALDHIGAQDKFIWERTSEWYAVDGEAGSYYDRAGRFRATVVPITRIPDEQIPSDTAEEVTDPWG